MKRLMFKMFVLLGCIIATLSFAAEKMKSIVTTCDETKVELTCTKQNETGCLASKLRFQPKGMPEHFIKLPKEIKEVCRIQKIPQNMRAYNFSKYILKELKLSLKSKFFKV